MDVLASPIHNNNAPGPAAYAQTAQALSTPYHLAPEGADSRAYYRQIAAFADQWTAWTRRLAGDAVQAFVQAYGAEQGPQRSLDERLFELLVLGVLLREHATQAARLPAALSRLLQALIRLQARYPGAERFLKGLRGGLAGWNGCPVPAQAARPGPSSVPAVLRWLRAHGEDAQAARLETWQTCLAAAPAAQAARLLDLGLDLANEFEGRSLAALGQFTTQVEAYRSRLGPGLRWRYDAALVSRALLEYHLGMLGTEVLNRAYRQAFQEAPRRLVILPPCLRAQPASGCQAVQTPLGARCTGCTPGCAVYQATRLAARQGIPVTCIPDDQLAQVCVSSGQSGSGLGVVGAACALRNWSAGWDAERLGLRAQGLLLDCAGCQKHWRQDPLPTGINLSELEQLLSQAA
ncbi:MAG: DUF116 domain-containing protein [Anaerolineaceae bacterium]|nr:DUF116 domain-containing protein [Anaerolineaceae bacterium]